MGVQMPLLVPDPGGSERGWSGGIMALICAVPTYADIAAVVGQDVVVINGGHSAARLRLDKVAPVFGRTALYFRAVLSGPPEAPLREGTHLSRVGDFLVRLR